MIFIKNRHYDSIWKLTFRHTIIPVQLALCFSLIVQGNNESQGILPAEESNSKFQTMKEKQKQMNFLLDWMHPSTNLPLEESTPWCTGTDPLEPTAETE